MSTASPASSSSAAAPEPSRQRRTRPTLLLGRLSLLLLVAYAGQGAHAFLLAPPRSPLSPGGARQQQQLLRQQMGGRPGAGLTARYSFLPSFRDEPWFSQTHDTMHVSEGGDDIVIETRPLPDHDLDHDTEAARVADSAEVLEDRGLHGGQQQQQQQHQQHQHQQQQVVVAEGEVVGQEAVAVAGRRKGTKGKGQPREYKVGIIVVDHGSRRAEANAALSQVVEDFKAVSGYALVEPAHMELAEPSIATAFGRCVEQGATFIVCHPFFLSRGRHVVEDIPTLLEEAASIFPGVGWALSQPLGLQAEIPKLMQSAVAEVMREQNIASEDHAASAQQQEQQEQQHPASVAAAALFGKDGMGL